MVEGVRPFSGGSPQEYLGPFPPPSAMAGPLATVPATISLPSDFGAASSTSPLDFAARPPYPLPHGPPTSQAGASTSSTSDVIESPLHKMAPSASLLLHSQGSAESGTLPGGAAPVPRTDGAFLSAGVVPQGMSGRRHGKRGASTGSAAVSRTGEAAGNERGDAAYGVTAPEAVPLGGSSGATSSVVVNDMRTVVTKVTALESSFRTRSDELGAQSEVMTSATSKLETHGHLLESFESEMTGMTTSVVSRNNSVLKRLPAVSGGEGGSDEDDMEVSASLEGEEPKGELVVMPKVRRAGAPERDVKSLSPQQAFANRAMAEADA